MTSPKTREGDASSVRGVRSGCLDSCWGAVESCRMRRLWDLRDMSWIRYLLTKTCHVLMRQRYECSERKERWSETWQYARWNSRLTGNCWCYALAWWPKIKGRRSILWEVEYAQSYSCLWVQWELEESDRRDLHLPTILQMAVTLNHHHFWSLW
jgi:hypothetical protein